MSKKEKLPIPDKNTLTGVIIAGGRGSRLGGQDKGFIRLHDRTLIEQIIEQISPQVKRLIINANRNLEQYRQLGLPVIEDDLPGFQGPLAGILTALHQVSTDFIITLPCDAPQLTSDYVIRMIKSLADSNAEIAVAHDGQRMQQMYALIPTSLAAKLEEFLRGDQHAIKHWFAEHELVSTDFSDIPTMFTNINTREDLLKLTEK